MNIYLGILILLINSIMAVKNYKNGFIAYFILCFTSPHIHLVNIIISYEIFAFIPIFVIFLCVYKRKKINYFIITFSLYFILLILSRFLATLKYDFLYNYIILFGYLRFIIITYIAVKILNDDLKSMDKVLTVSLFFNFFITIIQLTIPKSVNLFFNLYYKEGVIPLTKYLEYGIIKRGLGSFGMPTLLGAFALISWTFYLNQNKNRDIKGRSLKLSISLITGLLSLSKTFIIGAAVILIMSIFLNQLVYKKKFVFNLKSSFNKCIMLVGLIVSILVVLNLADKFNIGLYWYLDYLMKPLQAFNTRYVSYTSGVAINLKVIKDNIIMGVGPNTVLGEFLGDSMYLTVIHNTGIIGSVILLSFFGKLGFLTVINKDISKLLMILVLFLVGFAYPILFTKFGSIIIAFSYLTTKKMKGE
ncbi:hypothetical protein [Crassaminicella profunda]|uniref:hypothetical protein n=1 Tax=Crassaminicella profunda TaxID=1286698 RepID=UPI001CA75A11|nr:hypothetical protein [Crassaminicella profunda]QZY55556.1 hypothetical protein K7H06_00465 [Crassaminicella profunda]